MNTLIIGYNDNNYTVTGFNGTLDEANAYYIDNIFNIEEKSVRAVTCELYTEFKSNVYAYCMEQGYLIAEFNDTAQELKVVTKSLGLIKQTYTVMQECIDRYSGATLDNYIKVMDSEGLTSHQNLADFIASTKLYKSDLENQDTDKNYMSWLAEHVAAMQLEGY